MSSNTGQPESGDHTPSNYEYFPPATPAQQAEACARTMVRMWALDSVLNTQAAQELLTFAAFAMQSARSDTINAATAQLLIDATVTYGAAHLFDEMRPVGPGTPSNPATSAYSRYHGLTSDSYSYNPDITLGYDALVRDLHFVTTDELYESIRHWQSQPMIGLDRVEDFAQQYRIAPHRLFYFTRPLTHPEVDDVAAICGSNAPGALFIPAVIGQECGCVLTFTSLNSKVWLPFEPRSELPRQEVWRALLSHGVALLDGAQNELSTRAEESLRSGQSGIDLSRFSPTGRLRTDIILPESGALPARRSAVRRDLIGLFASHRLGSEHATWLNELVAKHAEHYQRLFDDKYAGHGSPDMTLTRSGVSAIDAVFRAIHTTLAARGQDNVEAYLLGAYFENEATQPFIVTDNPDRASIVFLGVEPTKADVNGTLRGRYAAKRDGTIKTIRQRAAREFVRAERRGTPPRDFYLIIDVTTDLMFRPFSGTEQLPPNLHIIEVASLTKHQRGERNHFFGLVADYSHSGLTTEIARQVPRTEGTLTETGILHFPRLTRSEIRTNLERSQQHIQQIARTFIAIQAKLPRDWRWRVEAYNSYIFLIPPYQRLRQFFQDRNTDPIAVDQATGAVTLNSRFMLFLQRYAYITLDPNLHRRPWVQIGNSFGLDITRVFHATSPWRDAVTGAEIMIPVPRVCPGLLTPLETDMALAAYLSDTAAGLTQELLSPNFHFPSGANQATN